MNKYIMFPSFKKKRRRKWKMIIPTETSHINHVKTQRTHATKCQCLHRYLFWKIMFYFCRAVSFDVSYSFPSIHFFFTKIMLNTISNNSAVISRAWHISPQNKKIIFDMWIFRESSNKCFAFIPQMFRIWCKNYSNATKKTNDSFMTYHFINTTTILLYVVPYSCIINMMYIFLGILFDMHNDPVLIPVYSQHLGLHNKLLNHL